jgi:hypothetical protein
VIKKKTLNLLAENKMLKLDMWRGMGIGLNSQLFLLQGHKQLIPGLKDEPGDQVHPFPPHPMALPASRKCFSLTCGGGWGLG